MTAVCINVYMIMFNVYARVLAYFNGYARTATLIIDRLRIALTLLTCCYILALMLTCFRLMKCCATFFQPQKIVESFLHLLWCHYSKWYLIMLQSTSLWCSIIIVMIFRSLFIINSYSVPKASPHIIRRRISSIPWSEDKSMTRGNQGFQCSKKN